MDTSKVRVSAKKACKPGDRIRTAAALALFLFLGCLRLQAQQGEGASPLPSDLASQNLSRVAAPAAQIEEVLRKEPGLLLELKRWVAKTATDHGQIVDESDLGDQAIFSRLSGDPEFRALATRLLQRYGHLVPKPAPGSEAAQELVSRSTPRCAGSRCWG